MPDHDNDDPAAYGSVRYLMDHRFANYNADLTWDQIQAATAIETFTVYCKQRGVAFKGGEAVIRIFKPMTAARRGRRSDQVVELERARRDSEMGMDELAHESSRRRSRWRRGGNDESDDRDRRRKERVL